MTQLAGRTSNTASPDTTMMCPDTVEPTDAELLDAYRLHGDDDAFQALVQRHGGMVLRVCRSVTRDPHVAEDAFQGTFLVLAKRAATMTTDRDSLAGWLCSVAYRVASRAAQRERKHQAREHTSIQPTREPSASDRDATVNEIREVIQQEMDRLPEQLRLPLMLCYLEAMTNEEAARALGWPVGTVKTRLAKGRDLMRRRLMRRGLTLGALLWLLMQSREAVADENVDHLVVVTTSMATGRSAVPERISSLVGPSNPTHSYFGLLLMLLGAISIAGAITRLTINASPPHQHQIQQMTDCLAKHL